MIEPNRIPTFTSQNIFKQYINTHFQNDMEAFITTINKSLNRYLSSDLKKAGLLVKKAKRCLRFVPKEYQPQVLAFEARYLHWTSRHTQAEKKYEQAIALAKTYRNWNAVARIRQGLADVYMYLGKYDAAREVGKKSLRYYRQKKMVALTGKMLTNLGNVYHRMDRNHTALAYYNKARQIFLEKKGLPLAIVEYNRANVYTNLHNYPQAAELYRAASRLYKQAGQHLFAAKAEYSLGYLHFLTGHYTQALRTLEQVYDTFVALGDKQAAAITNLDLAEINLHINQYSSAILYAEDSIPVFRKLGMRYEQARALYFSARSYFFLGDYYLTSQRLAKARRLCKLEKNNLWLGMVEIAFSDLYYVRGKYQQSHLAAVTARKMFSRSGDERRIIDAEIQIIKTLLQLKQQTSAKQHVTRLHRRKLTTYQLSNLNHILGWHQYQQGNYQKALSYFQTAIAAIGNMITELPEGEVRFFFSREKLTTFHGKIACLLRRGQAIQAFTDYLHMLEQLQFHHEKIRYRKSKQLSRLLTKRENLRASLNHLNRIPTNYPTTNNTNNSYYKTEQQLWELERKIRFHIHPTKKQAQPQRLLDAEYFRKHLQPDETVIAYLITDAVTGAFYTTRYQTGFQPLKLSPAELTTVVRELYFLLEQEIHGGTVQSDNMATMKSYLKKIYHLLIAPLHQHIVGKRVFLLLDGQVSLIPFAALMNDKEIWLKDEYRLSLIVNPVDITKQEHQYHDIAQWTNTILAVATEHLPAIEQECSHIKKLYTKVRIETQATTYHVKAALENSDGFLHIATHAAYSSENPLFSRLLMADGPLFPFDILNIEIKPILVNLSGCQTAASSVYYGSSFSLARSFYQAGSRFVLASLWQVSDPVSMKFMSEFYTALKKYNHVLTAYYEAQDNLSCETNNPVFWSPFVLLGV